MKLLLTAGGISNTSIHTALLELLGEPIAESSALCIRTTSYAHPMVQERDALLVNGGDPLYLCYWMRQSGLADLFPSLNDVVYVGLSAGSMVYAIDDQTAIKVSNGKVEVVSEGHWKRFALDRSGVRPRSAQESWA